MNGLQDCSKLVVGDEIVIPPCKDFPETDFTPAPTPSPTTRAPTPLPTPTPTTAPTNGTGGACCFYGECGAECLWLVGPGQWCGESQEHCAQCAPLGEWCAGGPTPSPTPHPTPSAGCSPLFDQCGGEGWTGPTCCVAGTYCHVYNQWYSQCIHEASSSSATADPRPRLRAGSRQMIRVGPHKEVLEKK